MVDTPDDIELIAELLSGSEDAISAVRTWVQSELWRFRGQLRSETEDLEQEVLLHLMEALDANRFRHESRLETYVRSCVRFKCIDRLRAMGRREMIELDQELLLDDGPSPADTLSQRQDNELVLRVVAEVSPPCRELWEMVVDGLSYREMSEVLGVPEGAVRVRVHRCRQRALAVRRRIVGEDL